MAVELRSELVLTTFGPVRAGSPHGYWHADATAEGAAGGGNIDALLAVPRGSRVLLCIQHVTASAIGGNLITTVSVREAVNGGAQIIIKGSIGDGSATYENVNPLYWWSGPDTLDVLRARAGNVDGDDLRLQATGIYWDLQTLRQLGVGPDLRCA